jgi:UDP-N-acetylmuramate dehydrogenase
LTLSDKQILELSSIVGGKIKLNEPLARHTSYKIGGPADAMVEIIDAETCVKLQSFLRVEKLPSMILGGGTNVLFSDAGFRGVVLHTASMNEIEITPTGEFVLFEVGSGLPLPALATKTYKMACSGLEHLWGIPGSVGGAITGNAGTPEIGICECVERLTLIDTDQNIRVLERPELKYSYRKLEMGAGAIVTRAEIRLKRDSADVIEKKLAEARSKRQGKQPINQFSAGCVFKNPAGQPAGRLIEKLGFKGKKVGDAQVSTFHANFIVNTGSARASDVLELIAQIKAEALAVEGIELELEIRVFGENI